MISGNSAREYSPELEGYDGTKEANSKALRTPVVETETLAVFPQFLGACQISVYLSVGYAQLNLKTM